MGCLLAVIPIAVVVVLALYSCGKASGTALVIALAAGVLWVILLKKENGGSKNNYKNTLRGGKYYDAELLTAKSCSLRYYDNKYLRHYCTSNIDFNFVSPTNANEVYDSRPCYDIWLSDHPYLIEGGYESSSLVLYDENKRPLDMSSFCWYIEPLFGDSKDSLSIHIWRK